MSWTSSSIFQGLRSKAKILQTQCPFFIFLQKNRLLKSLEPLHFFFYRRCRATTAGTWILKPDTPRPKILRQRSSVGLRLCMAWARHLRHATMPLPIRPCQRSLHCWHLGFRLSYQNDAEFDNFDQIALAQKLEKHELIEMRRIATLVYQKNKRYKQAIELAQQDKMYKEHTK
eukprot:s4281_g7.t1